MIVQAIPAIFIASMFVCHSIAKWSGAKPVFWVGMGVLLRPMAIPFAFFAKPA